MKNLIAIVTILISAAFGHAEVITCTGITNDPNTTKMNFEIEIQGKPYRLEPRLTSYKSVITYTTHDGSHLKQSIDLNSKPRTRLNKVIYTGSISNNYLELNLDSANRLLNAVLNNPLAGFDKLPSSSKDEIEGVDPN